jgi:hypothetical protein
VWPLPIRVDVLGVSGPARTAGERFEDGYIAEATMRAMLEEWLTSYDIETRCYNSGALEAEVTSVVGSVLSWKIGLVD